MIKNKIFSNFYIGIKGGYSLTDEAFSQDMIHEVQRKTPLRLSRSLDDWWITEPVNIELSWKELVQLSVTILSTRVTKAYLHNIAFDQEPEFDFLKVDEKKLPESYVRGAKRVNFSRGEYHDFTGAMGMDMVLNPKRAEAIMMNPPKKDSGLKWRGSGKDESCMVEGSWFDWACLALNVFASKNTNIICPKLYEPFLKNDNY